MGGDHVRPTKTDRQVAERMAARVADREAFTSRVLHEVRVWEVDHECAHGALPGDLTQQCGCWRGLEVREAEALRHDIQALTKAMERYHDDVKAILTAIHAQTEVLAHVDRNVTAVGYQVSQNGR